MLTGSFYKLLLLKAQRSGELGLASWSEFDLVNRWWIIPAERAKNGLPHRVPISGLTLTVLKTLRFKGGGSQWVFPSPKKDSAIKERKRRLQKIRDRSGIQFWAHDLRRTAASHMTSIGIPRLTVSKILNHAENSITAVYDRHSYDREKKDALEEWGEYIKSLLNGDNFLSPLALKYPPLRCKRQFSVKEN